MDFKNVDLSNFKIPDIAQGKISPPHGVYKRMEQEEKERKQRLHNWKIAIFSAVVALLIFAAGEIISFYLNQPIK